MTYAYKQNNDQQKEAIMGAIAGLMNELQTLAPHPNAKGYKGPIFIKNNANFKASNGNDEGMLGSMMLEAIMGVAMQEAMSEMSEMAPDFLNNIDLGDALDCYSEYMCDVEAKTRKIAAHGQGTMARMSGTSISSCFNIRASIDEDMQSFLEDLPRRMVIEQNLAHYARQLDALSMAPKMQYAAPKPRMAA